MAQESPVLSGGEEIRRMRVGDLDQVMDIEVVSFPTPWSREAYRREIADNSYAHYLVMLAGGEIIGYGGMWVVLDEAHVTNLAVTPARQRQGCGRRLLSALIELAAALGADRLTLEVRRSNRAAQMLYLQHGFVACGARRNYYADTQEDAVVMVKEGLRTGRR
ncbi:MAG TPA: ribosomal protein S18-alanine N-acetyltransferase [Bacillota bacterium]|nr:ribosomal protein S18-alanine N-acetyltransferase [Bacillota bacterium]